LSKNVAVFCDSTFRVPISANESIACIEEYSARFLPLSTLLRFFIALEEMSPLAKLGHAVSNGGGKNRADMSR